LRTFRLALKSPKPGFYATFFRNTTFYMPFYTARSLRLLVHETGLF
jgi:hypothetical protein